jgi:hypothetical protein
MYFAKLDAKWRGFAKIALSGIPEERRAVCHAAFLVGAATICNILPLQDDDATAAEIEEFFADVEAACGHEARRVQRARAARAPVEARTATAPVAEAPNAKPLDAAPPLAQPPLAEPPVGAPPVAEPPVAEAPKARSRRPRRAHANGTPGRDTDEER